MNFCIYYLTGYDKLKPFGFPVHASIDGYSRRVLWLEVVRSNNLPDVPARQQHQPGTSELKTGGRIFEKCDPTGGSTFLKIWRALVYSI
jgi:hypothetical protein